MSPPDQNPDIQRRTPRIIYVAIAFGVLYSVCFAVQSAISLRHASERRDIGWSWERVDGSWQVREVAVAGPADGRLQSGDVVLAIDGDPRIAEIGPWWVLRNGSLDAPYEVLVRRGSEEVAVSLSQRLAFDSGAITVTILSLITGLSLAVLAIVMVVARPLDAAVRGGFWGASIAAVFYLWHSSGPLDGVLQGWELTLQLLFSCSYPLYFWGVYRFFAGFPENRPEEGGWRLFLNGVWLGAVALWIPRLATNLVQIPRDLVVDLVYAGRWFYVPHALVEKQLETAYTVVVLVGACVAMVRNYQRLPEGPSRRRIRWIAVPMLATVIAVVVTNVVEMALVLGGAPDAAVASATQAKLVADGFVVIMPLVLGYAIAKHQVMGIQLVARLGVQYLFAKTVLQVAVALPALWLTWTLVSNPDATVGQLLFQGSGRTNLAALFVGVVVLWYRRPVREAIDRKFFRGEYDREQILVGLGESVHEVATIPEIARTVATRVDEALHVERAVVLFRTADHGRFVVSHSTVGTGAHEVVPGTSGLLTKLDDAKRPLRWDQVRAACPADERDWLERMDLALLVPILGVEKQQLVGVLMLGPKRSEEPYTARDRSLLQAVAAQAGIVYEVLALQAEVSRERRIQKEVLRRLEHRDINVLKVCPTCGRCYDRDDETCEDDESTLELSLPVVRTVDERYHLVREIGRGAMGAVFRARDLRLDRTVAIKILMGSLFGDPAAQRRFAREAQATARLVHPNIIRVYDFGELEGEGAYLVMELVDGETWKAAATSGGGISRPVLVDLADQLMDGVHAAHEAGVVHRDLKPDNILLTDLGARRPGVKILDFGLAKVWEMGLADPMSVTATGAVMGTVGYMSPEQFFGDSVDQRADVYSIAVIIVESLTGRLKRRGYAVHEQVRRQLHNRLGGEDASPESRALVAILDRGLAWERGERFSTVGEMRDHVIPALRMLSETDASA